MIKKFFPGANSAQGFYSLYDYMIKDPLLKIILKGGPGVGKSTFIKRIANQMAQDGFEVELHCCSSDSNSLDGTVIEGKVAIVDGTDPHQVDPVHPGVMDEIINLGEYWDKKALLENREEIIHLGIKIKGYFKEAYSYLREAGIFYCKIRDCFRDVPNEDEILSKLKKVIFPKGKSMIKGRNRHLFASAITPHGVINHLDTLLDDMEKIYMLKGKKPAGEDRIIKGLRAEATKRGFNSLSLHCGLLPQSQHHLILDDLKIACISENPFLKTPSLREVYKIIPLVQERTVAVEELEELEKEFLQLLENASKEILKSRDLHYQREEFYKKAMDFQQVDLLIKKTLERFYSSLRV